MFRDLLNRLMGDMPPASPLQGEDAELAIAALLVRVARADDHYDEAERRHIDRVLACRRGLTPDEAAARRLQAEEIEAEAADTVRFTRQIKDRIPLDDRSGVLEAMWEVTYVDGKRTSDEESLVRLVAGLLGINDRDSALIRQRVLADLGISDG